MRSLVVAGALATGMALFLIILVLVVIGGSGSGRPTPGVPGVVCAPPGIDASELVEGFGPEQVSNAGLIVATGAEMGVPSRGMVIAVATAMQESVLKNYANSTVPESLQHPHEAVGSDHDSVGLFQQREAGWGDVATRMDPRQSARLFYDALLEVPGWETMPLTRAAQLVQVSAFPDAYAKWEQPAATLVGALEGVICGPGTGGGNLPPADPQIQRVIDRAMAQQGQPYVWAGGDANGPTLGGFDCSGLMVYAFAGIGVGVPHQTQAIWAAFQPAITDPAALAPGDMVLFSSNGQAGGIHHVGLYLGNGQMLHAPQTGDVVKVEPDIWSNPYYSAGFIGAVRATNPTAA
ncbi:C40 family peptidase [Pseudonocardia sp. NPDC049635]|uniref:C40 family peptidase n=1 Tax=Pseudonocardia sp. NPDC049635 TaxID=3155506 RepID=UPI0033D2C306